jgi:hypothetical protein
VVLLGDGAEWIWHRATHFLGARGVELVEIVDIYHVYEYLWGVGNIVFGAESARAAGWVQPLKDRLYEQGAAPVLAALAALTPETEEATEDVRVATGYITTHAARLDYPRFVARQFPIGSGAVESTCKVLIAARAKGAGMRWSGAGLQAIASLRVVHRSGRWDSFWQTQPQRRSPYLHALPRPRRAPASVATVPPQAPPHARGQSTVGIARASAPSTPEAAASPAPLPSAMCPLRLSSLLWGTPIRAIRGVRHSKVPAVLQAVPYQGAEMQAHLQSAPSEGTHMDRTELSSAIIQEMQVLVGEALEAVVPDMLTAGLATLEQRVQQVGRVILGGLIERVAVAHAQGLPRPARCPTCHGPLKRRERPRPLVGLVGDYTLRRPYYWCATCKQGAAPLDVALGLGPGGVSPGLARVVVRAAVEATFTPAAEQVQEALGATISDETVRRLAERIGAAAEAQTQAAIARARQGQPVWTEEEMECAVDTTILAVEVDGVLVHQGAGWYEMKVVTVAPLGPDLYTDPESKRTHLA